LQEDEEKELMEATNEDELEHICFNCNDFFSATSEATEFGICLQDEDFDPFIDQLLEDLNYSCCRDLIERKKFSGEKEGCPEFTPVERIEIDDDSELGQALQRSIKDGKLSEEDFERAIAEELFRQTDWENVPKNMLSS